MKERKPIGKTAAAISACLAALLLCTTVFASGALAAQGGVYETTAVVLRDGVALDYEQRPFVAEGVTFVPLRETLSSFVDLSGPLSNLTWLGDGRMELNLFDPASIRRLEDGRAVYALLYHYELVIGEAKSFSGAKTDFTLSAPPVLKDGVTYVPIDFLQKVQRESGLLKGFSVN